MLNYLMIGLMGLWMSCASMNADKWNGWIGHPWQSFQSAAPHRTCTPAGDTVDCGGGLTWTIDGNGIITGWKYN